MTFEKERLYTSINANKLKDYSVGLFGEEYWELVDHVEDFIDGNNIEPVFVLKDEPQNKFTDRYGHKYPYFYLVKKATLFSKDFYEIKNAKNIYVNWTRGKGSIAIREDKVFKDYAELKDFYKWNFMTLQFIKLGEKRFDAWGLLEMIEEDLKS